MILDLFSIYTTNLNQKITLSMADYIVLNQSIYLSNHNLMDHMILKIHKNSTNFQYQ